MYRRWASAYQFQWTPILTYARRRLELLDWLEDNVNPVAFSDTDAQRLGIAMVARDLRVVVSRSGMNVSSGLSGVPVGRLLPVIGGIFSVLEPADAVLENATVAASHDLDQGGSYHEECARFAVRMAGLGPLGAAFRPIDASVIADLESSEVKAQVEWGIVDREELLQRLSDPSIGRLNRRPAPSGSESHSHSTGTFVDGLPSVSVFTDLYIERRHGNEVGDVDDVSKMINVVDGQAETIAEGLVEHYLAQQEGSK